MKQDAPLNPPRAADEPCGNCGHTRGVHRDLPLGAGLALVVGGECVVRLRAAGAAPGELARCACDRFAPSRSTL